MLGPDAVRAALGGEPGAFSELNKQQRDRLESLVDGRREQFAAALVAEAADSDDVSDAESASAYAELRLREFEGILSPTVRQRLHAAFRERTADWG